MNIENYKYWCIKNTDEGRAEAMSKGFSLGSVSGDGSIMLVDNNTDIEYEWINYADKPIWITIETPNYPCLSIEEARIVTSYQSTSEGASDGWTYQE